MIIHRQRDLYANNWWREKKKREIFLPKASKFLFRPQSEKISENFPDCE